MAVIGIDLGTTNSLASICKIKPTVLKNSENEIITPSCVALERTSLKCRWLVGRTAKNMLKMSPGETVVSVKRLMGRKWVATCEGARNSVYSATLGT